MQTNQNREEKNIVERWDWHDGFGKSPATKKVFRKLRRKRQKRILDKAIEEVISSMQNVAPQDT